MSADWPSKALDRPQFPLATVGQVRKLFENHLATNQPNLTLLSIVAGFVENSLTQVKEAATAALPATGQPDASDDNDVTNVNVQIEPNVSWDIVETLMTKFQATIKGFCDAELLATAKSSSDVTDTRMLIKHIADIVWNTLSKSQYKDRPHLQSIYSYLTGNGLDCFGVAYAVVAACQLLEIDSVHLALSEDHAWVVFGTNGSETAEVTWHGKGSEDKRGQPVEASKAKVAWLYVAGQPTICDRFVEVAAMVSAINPAVNSATDSLEVGALQQELMWLLYDLNHLKTFPMALGNLADLEEIAPTVGRPHCSKLYEEAVTANRSYYSNHHVYPYTYQGGYYYRHKQFKKAIESWSMAAQVMKTYNYSKDDEEIYKEFMEIANEFIPQIVKSQLSTESELLKDSDTFVAILKFYDGLCSWEEGSTTPIMHIGWAKPMVATVSKFDSEVRLGVAEDEGNVFKTPTSQRSPATTNPSPSSSLACSGLSAASPALSGVSPSSSLVCSSSAGLSTSMSPGAVMTDCLDHECFQKLDFSEVPDKNSNNFDCDLLLKSTSSKRHGQNCDIDCENVRLADLRKPRKKRQKKLIETLSQACGDNLLNLQYLVGQSGVPFDRLTNPLDVYSKRRSTKDLRLYVNTNQFNVSEQSESKKVVDLSSAKMRGLRSLLSAEKLNASAIQLQLTAQSQSADENHARPKRSRRE